ncbi:endonuclease/exonuclease/phosphatase family protein [Miltoncostaea marina]|uniref:endonuclease/exonuclease/phosphatase family protein n=1 Tax=Miltoncostaea marina TaxID=2843215 RepID=UPI001C3E1663|nr:endonuclease/exonuclease/phosphatase family protein [Miltoncostaea marina]
MPATTVRVVTWNLFHARDGLPGLGATRRSTWLRSPVDDGVHVHLNRKHTGPMARRIAAWAPDLCALQEVPTAAIRELVAVTGMRAVWAPTGPLIGPRRLRDALAARNPDLWRTHEGNANVLLVGPRLAIVPGSARSVRLNPPGPMLRAALRGRIGAGELLRYLPEPRRLVVARVRLPGGAEAVAGCVHCHNARDPELTGLEIARAAREVAADAGGGPAVLAGDLNARPGHPALAALAAAGWDHAAPAAGAGIDRILSRGLATVEAPRALPAAEREVAVRAGERRRLVRLSDHDPVVATLRAPTASAG